MTTCKQVVITLMLAVTGVSCSLDETQAAPNKTAVKRQASAPQRKAGYVTGRATTHAGKPLRGVTVGIYGTTTAGANTRFEALTDVAGRFSQRVPEGIYGASAYYKTKFNGKNYNFTLHPKDGTTAIRHDSSRGIVKEFVWKISGLKPGQSAGDSDTSTEALKYYGGYIYLTSKEEGFGGERVYFPARSTLFIILTPRGALMDGSRGRTLTFRRAFSTNVTSGLGTHLTDIPLGLYTLRAALELPDGTRKALNVKRSLDFSAPFTPSTNVDFEPTNFGDVQMMQITIEP